MSSPLISVIIAAYNASKHIGEAICSVTELNYGNWELIVVNNGSDDNTDDIVKGYLDKRIRYFEQQNLGVSAARNLGLEKMQGQYFCFLDADDVMPADSLISRLTVFQEQPDISFVDGMVVYMNEDMTPSGRQYIPSFKGYPYNELLKLNRTCYFGNTWMIKREAGVNYRFSEEMTHAEDLFFYLTISKGRKYSYTSKPVLFYRVGQNSAMKNLDGLEQGYFKLLNNVRKELNPDPVILQNLKRRIMRIIFLSHLIDGFNPLKAFRSLFRFS